jgi:hypothetical protein
MQQTQIEIGDYHLDVRAVYWPENARWQPVLRISHSRRGADKPVHQYFNQLPAVSRSEEEAIEYGLAKGRFLVEGAVIGLMI